jgi:hypothetical protein
MSGCSVQFDSLNDLTYMDDKNVFCSTFEEIVDDLHMIHFWKGLMVRTRGYPVEPSIIIVFQGNVQAVITESGNMTWHVNSNLVRVLNFQRHTMSMLLLHCTTWSGHLNTWLHISRYWQKQHAPEDALACATATLACKVYVNDAYAAVRLHHFSAWRQLTKGQSL